MLPLLLGMPLVLTPIHIAFLEMIIDPACSLVFEAEDEEEADVMRRPPRDSRIPLLVRRRMLWALLQGVVALAILAAVLVWSSRTGSGSRHRVLCSAPGPGEHGTHRGEPPFEASLTRALLEPNRALRLLLSAVLLLLAVTVYWPPAKTLFHFGTLHATDVAICVAVAAFGLGRSRSAEEAVVRARGENDPLLVMRSIVDGKGAIEPRSPETESASAGSPTRSAAAIAPTSVPRRPWCDRQGGL